ncbi:YdcF family protein [Antarctobacter sp.]|uniref:YdcF family protein n=1 Tax=Antarctobacter sp. TaxID=1872577 RepID=UPI002B26553D|nr:YdcF family protein [Antarctobacter sp.]
MGINRRLVWFLKGTALYTALCLLLTTGSTLLTRDCSEVDTIYDIAVVLGGGTEHLKRVQAEESGRIHAGITLYDRAKVSRLHLTGGPPDKATSNALLLAKIARAEGIPDTDLKLETGSLSTLQNALFSRPDLPVDARLILVTEAYHGWRARASFAWSGRPADVCASRDPGRTPFQQAKVLARETAAWGVNIPRAALWSLAQLVGLGDRMPTALLT